MELKNLYINLASRINMLTNGANVNICFPYFKSENDIDSIVDYVTTNVSYTHLFYTARDRHKSLGVLLQRQLLTEALNAVGAIMNSKSRKITILTGYGLSSKFKYLRHQLTLENIENKIKLVSHEKTRVYLQENFTEKELKAEIFEENINRILKIDMGLVLKEISKRELERDVKKVTWYI